MRGTNRMLLLLLAGLVCAIYSPLAGRADEQPAAAPLTRFEYQQVRMATPFRIALYAADEASANAAADEAFGRIKQLNDLFSDYDAESELSRLCRLSGPGKPVGVSPELFEILTRATSLSKQSNGAFDATIGPVVGLWRVARRKRQFPDPARLTEARSRVGYQLVRLDEQARTVELLHSGMRLDLGGIAKGYACDQALAVLKKHGIARAMVSGGGDIVGGDPPPDRTGWTIGIAALLQPDETPAQFISLKNAATSTSGDAYRFVVIDGKRYSHIVDPKTGIGITESCSVTVIAPDGTTSDALATAAAVLGPKAGLELIEKSAGCETLFVTLREGKPVAVRSKGFAGYETTGLRDR